MQLTSPAFSEGDTLDVRFTCDGEDLSPPLAWSDVPDGSSELRLSVTDPDAPSGTFTHWLVTGIDPSAPGVGQGAVPEGGAEQENSFGNASYGGPCPPKGTDHRYVFTIEALDDAGVIIEARELNARYGR